MSMLEHPAFSAPHRLLFLTGSIGAMLSMAPWLLQLAGLGVFQAVPPPFAHAALMLFSVFPFFILGFIYTAGPRWLQVAGPDRGAWLPAWGLLVVGLLTLAIGLMVAKPAALVGAVLYFLGWSYGVWQHVKHIRQSPASDKLHAYWVLVGFVAGGFSLLALAAWLALDDMRYWAMMRDLALWGFLAPVYIAVCHRMIPFFSSNVLTGYQAFRPRWTLNALAGLCLLHLALSLAGLAQWLWIADVPLAAVALLHVVRWNLWRSRTIPLLFVMHLAHAWLPIAALLYAVQSLGLLQGHYIAGTAPAHALSIGFYSSMLIAFAARVTLGHSGRPLAWTKTAAAAFWLVQSAALGRIALALWPHQHGMIAIAALWLAAFACWNVYHAPIYIKPRADGQSG